MNSMVTMDFCRIQRMINQMGGIGEFPAFQPSKCPGDRLTEYGFCRFPDSMYFDEVRDEFRYHARPGVYAVWAVSHSREADGYVFPQQQHVLYIGSSKNVRSRIETPGHWPQRCLDRNWPNHISVVIEVLYTDQYRWVERSLIEELRPLLNIQHKNG